MGKGDKKTRKGKIIMGSYGKKRPRDPYKNRQPANNDKTTKSAS